MFDDGLGGLFPDVGKISELSPPVAIDVDLVLGLPTGLRIDIGATPEVAWHREKHQHRSGNADTKHRKKMLVGRRKLAQGLAAKRGNTVGNNPLMLRGP